MKMEQQHPLLIKPIVKTGIPIGLNRDLPKSTTANSYETAANVYRSCDADPLYRETNKSRHPQMPLRIESSEIGPSKQGLRDRTNIWTVAGDVKLESHHPGMIGSGSNCSLRSISRIEKYGPGHPFNSLRCIFEILNSTLQVPKTDFTSPIWLVYYTVK